MCFRLKERDRHPLIPSGRQREEAKSSLSWIKSCSLRSQHSAGATLSLNCCLKNRASPSSRSPCSRSCIFQLPARVIMKVWKSLWCDVTVIRQWLLILFLRQAFELNFEFFVVENLEGKLNLSSFHQGLTGATRDTYDALQMQPILPPR